jgi:hypothetical protein
MKSSQLDSQLPRKTNDMIKLLTRVYGYEMRMSKHIVLSKTGSQTISFPNEREVSDGVRRQIRNILFSKDK